MKAETFLACLILGALTPALAAPLTESTFTDIIKDVNVVSAASKASSPAQLRALLKAPDLVRTGPDSRAELTAPDQTITRVGANTVFSFEPTSREMRLEKGNVLFHSPAGKGGGTIHSGGASAAVLGTTIVVVAVPGNGFKVIVLEGKAKVVLPDGKTFSLKAGQLIFILPGSTAPSGVLTINLGKLVGGSQLVNGFANPLPSLALIQAAIEAQNKLIAGGGATDTGVSADDFARGQHPGNGLHTIDENTYDTLILPLSSRQLQKSITAGPFQ